MESSKGLVGGAALTAQEQGRMDTKKKSVWNNIGGSNGQSSCQEETHTMGKAILIRDRAQGKHRTNVH